MLGIVGAIDSDGDSIVLLLLVYAGQLFAGYMGGRYAGFNGAFHGGLAALALTGMTMAFSVAAAIEPTFVTIVFSLIVAAIIGTAGGALADWQRLDA